VPALDRIILDRIFIFTCLSAMPHVFLILSTMILASPPRSSAPGPLRETKEINVGCGCAELGPYL